MQVVPTDEEARRGALARLGVRTPGQTCPDIHQPTFRVDEACIAVGLKVLAEVATSR